jgi:hypothetical protein
MREHAGYDMNFITAPYADTSDNRRGWGEIGDGRWSELQRDPRHWGGQIRYTPVLVAKTKSDADEDARDKAA